MRRLIVCAFAVVCVVAACGGQGDSGDDVASCPTAHTLLCDRACDCTAGDGCTVVFGDGVATANSNNYRECTGFWTTLGCQDPSTDGVDWDECTGALEAAECTTAGDKIGVKFPGVCSSE